MKRFPLGALALAACFAAAAVFLCAQENENTSLADYPPVENIQQAVYFLKIHRNMEEDNLRALFTRYQGKRQEEQDVLEQLNALNYEADAQLASRVPAGKPAEGAQDNLERLDDAEAHFMQLTLELKRLRGQMGETRERIAGFNRKMEELLASIPEDSLNVTGAWLVSLQPARLTGEMRLFQNGVLVTGSYRLSGNWRGSVRGWVAGKQLVLERFDAELGRAGEFVALLSDDGKELSGRWSNFDLSVGPSAGPFTAKRLKQ